MIQYPQIASIVAPDSIPEAEIGKYVSAASALIIRSLTNVNRRQPPMLRHVTGRRYDLHYTLETVDAQETQKYIASLAKAK